jgi:hypothetical protein
MKIMLIAIVICLTGCKRVDSQPRTNNKEVLMYCVPADQFEARYEN